MLILFVARDERENYPSPKIGCESFPTLSKYERSCTVCVYSVVEYRCWVSINQSVRQKKHTNGFFSLYSPIREDKRIHSWNNSSKFFTRSACPLEWLLVNHIPSTNALYICYFLRLGHLRFTTRKMNEFFETKSYPQWCDILTLQQLNWIVHGQRI